MNFIRCSLDRFVIRNKKKERFYTSDLDLNYRVFVSWKSLSMYEIELNGKIHCVVRYSCFNSHNKFELIKVATNLWEGHPDGIFGFSDRDEVLVNGEVVGKITNNDFFLHLWERIKTLTYKKFDPWYQIDFDAEKLSPDNALALLFMRISLFES